MEDHYISRSQKKRDSIARQKAGEELAALSPAQLKLFSLSPDLVEALAFWRALTDHEAKRRHMQYIGRLMREEDNPEAILTTLEALKQQRHGSAAAFHHIERLRDELLAPNPADREQALEKALADMPRLERGKLRHLADSAVAEREKGRPPKAARQLFRYLKESEQAKNAEDSE